MGTRAVVLLDNPSFSSDDQGEKGRADSGFYVHYDGYPDTLGQALLQMGRSGAFNASSMVNSGEISYFTGIYPNNSNPGGPEDGDRVIDLGGGAVGLAGVDNSPMGDYASDYRFDPDYMIEVESGDLGDADYIYVVGEVGVWYDSPGYGGQGFAEYGGRFASRTALYLGDDACPVCGEEMDGELEGYGLFFDPSGGPNDESHPLLCHQSCGPEIGLTPVDPDATFASVRTAVRYPDVEVQLTGSDGNAFAVLGAVMKALRRAGVPQEEIDEFMDDAQSGDYDHLLQTCMEWVEVY